MCYLILPPIPCFAPPVELISISHWRVGIQSQKLQCRILCLVCAICPWPQFQASPFRPKDFVVWCSTGIDVLLRLDVVVVVVRSSPDLDLSLSLVCLLPAVRNEGCKKVFTNRLAMRFLWTPYCTCAFGKCLLFITVLLFKYFKFFLLLLYQKLQYQEPTVCMTILWPLLNVHYNLTFFNTSKDINF